MAKILVVEDDSKLRADLERLLVQASHHVDTASGGNQAVVRLKEKRYDLLMTDLMMEEGTGFDVLTWVTEHAPGLPIVICSSYAKTENLKTFLNTQQYRIVRKPYQSEELVRQVKELLDGRV